MEKIFLTSYLTSPFLVAYIFKKSLTDLCRVILYHLYQTY